jgi:hypothetical protein
MPSSSQAGSRPIPGDHLELGVDQNCRLKPNLPMLSARCRICFCYGPVDCRVKFQRSDWPINDLDAAPRAGMVETRSGHLE